MITICDDAYPQSCHPPAQTLTRTHTHTPAMGSGRPCCAARSSSRVALPWMECVGQLSSACVARTRPSMPCGCCATALCPLALLRANTFGAIHRHVSQSMHVESTQKGPSTLPGERTLCAAAVRPGCCAATTRREPRLIKEKPLICSAAARWCPASLIECCIFIIGDNNRKTQQLQGRDAASIRNRGSKP